MGFKIKELAIIHLCYAISFLLSGIIINMFQLILFLTVKPFNKFLYRKINYYLLYSFYSQLVFMIEWWGEGVVHVYIDKEVYDKYYGKEHGYLLMNHSYEIDWLVGWQFCDKIGVLGNCKAYAKKSIQYMPPIGWMWKFGEYVFLARSFDKDKEIIRNQIEQLGEYPDPIWLLLFPEGTRFSTKKHQASQKFAQEKGLPSLEHHLTPRTKGFSTSLEAMSKDKFPAIYDIQIAFDRQAKVEPTMTSLLFGKKVTAHLYINRIPTEDMPRSEKESAEWLHNLFAQKDRMQASFHKTGDFFAESGVKRTDHWILERRYYSLLNTAGWAAVILLPMFYWLFGLLFSGELLLFSSGVAVLGIFQFVMKYLIGMSKISKASSYGAEKKQ